MLKSEKIKFQYSIGSGSSWFTQFNHWAQVKLYSIIKSRIEWTIKRTINEKSTQFSFYFLRVFRLWDHAPFNHVKSPQLGEYSNCRCSTPDRHRYVFWSCNLLFSGILFRPSLFLNTRDAGLRILLSIIHYNSADTRWCHKLYLDG